MTGYFSDPVKVIDFIVVLVGLLGSLLLRKCNLSPRLTADTAALPVVWQLIRVSIGSDYQNKTTVVVFLSVLALATLVLLNFNILPWLAVIPFAILAFVWMIMLFGSFTKDTNPWLFACILNFLHYTIGTFTVLSSAAYLTDLKK